MSSSKKRKLAAILFADIVGYTALMQQGEATALSMVSKFEQITATESLKFNGDIIKKYGDGCLILFESGVHATQAALQMQLGFQKEPAVPVRIGIHVGEVIVKDDDVFGNGINLASRVESMGVPGSVLLSGRAQRSIRNQEDLESVSVGTFQFKNVEEKVEIFALQHPQLIIPTKKEMQGKVVKKKPGLSLGMKLVAAIGTLLLLGLGYQIVKGSPDERSIPKSDKEKRLAVLPFKNQTLDPELDIFGTMISDWVTQGLMGSGEANIVKASNIQPFFNDAKLSTNPNPEFAQKTGIDLIIEGRYYLAENRLILIADLIEVTSGKVLKTFQLEKGKEERIELLDQLNQELLGYWSVRKSLQYESNPPLYAAYQEWIKGVEFYAVDAKKAEQHFEQAYLLDSTFYDPVFRLISLNLGAFSDHNKAREMIEFLGAKQSSFTRYESLTYDIIKATSEKDYLRAAKVNEELVEMDPSDSRANYNSGYFYTLAHRPAKVLKVLKNFDQRLIHESNALVSWRFALEAAAYFRLGQYENVLEVERTYPFPNLPTPLGVITLQSLVRLDSMDLLEKTYKRYLEQGVFSPAGTKDLPDHLLVCISNELYLMDRREALYTYAGMLEDWLKNNRVVPYPHLAPDIYNNRPFRQEESLGYVDFYFQKFDKALAHWTVEQVPESNWPDQMERYSRLGVCQAMLGDTTGAMRNLDQIEAFSIDHPHLYDTKRYYQSRIYSALGNVDKAVDCIVEAIDHGIVFFRPYIFKIDPFLKPLFGYPSFEEAVAPKPDL